MKIDGKLFYFVRHAESIWNAKNLCQGQKNIELSDRGRQNSLKFSHSLSTFPIKCICSSPLKRAHDTAKMILNHHPNVHLTLLDEFMERHWGDLEGGPSQEMFAIEHKEESDPSYILEHGIEGKDVLIRRIIKGLNKAFQLSPTPFIVSHGRLLHTLFLVLGLPPMHQAPNLSLIEFRQKSDAWSYSIISKQE